MSVSEELATPDSIECAQQIADLVNPTLDVILHYRTRLDGTELSSEAADEMTVELHAQVLNLLFGPTDQLMPTPGQPTGEDLQ